MYNQMYWDTFEVRSEPPFIDKPVSDARIGELDTGISKYPSANEDASFGAECESYIACDGSEYRTKHSKCLHRELRMDITGLGRLTHGGSDLGRP